MIDHRSVLLCVALRAAGVAGCALLSALTWALLLPSAALAAPEVISLNSLKESWLLGAGAEVWIDEEGATSTLSEALERAEWRAARRPREAVRLRQGTLWVHARVRDDLPRGGAAPEWRVSFSHPRPVSLTSYVPRGGRLVELRGGLEQPLDAREVPSTSVVVPFEPRPGVVEDLYFKIESTPLGFAAHISSRDEWSRGELRAERLFGLYYGLALGLFLYNSFLLITLRDITYQWYLLVLLSNVLFFAARNGYIWSSGWTPSLLGGGGLVALQIAAMLSFTRSLLMTRVTVPRVDRLLRALLIVVNVMFIVTLSWTTPIAELAMSPLSVLSVALCLLAGSLRLTQGSAVARYFMLGWGLFLAGGVMYGVKFTGLIPHTPLTEHALQVGSALEMVLFSLALADRIRDLQRASAERDRELDRVRLTHTLDLIALREESARRLIEAQDERNRVLASDLHDSVGHRFLLIMREAAEWVKPEAARDPSHEALLSISALAEEGIAETRELAHGLYPQRLLDLGLESALTSSAEALERLGVRASALVAPGLSERLTPAARLTALRVAEEALQNALRHGECGAVWLCWAAEGEGAVLLVEDDGVGISGGEVEGGLGLRTMRDRATQAGGEVVVARRAEGGTRVRLWVPFGG